MLNINPVFMEKDDEFKSKSFNNMRFFYKNDWKMKFDDELRIVGECKEEIEAL